MIDLSNCTIAEVKTFLGLRTINPSVPVDEFIDNNIHNLESLIEKNQIIVLDDHGKEVDSVIWKDYFRDYYRSDDEEAIQEEIIPLDDEDDEVLENNDEEAIQDERIPLDEDDEVLENNDEEAIQEELELINKIDVGEKAKIAHKNRLTKSLENCDEPSKFILKKGIKLADKKIEELQSKRRTILIRINRKINE